MFLFRPEHKPKILNGDKTQTRRIWKKNRANVGSIHEAKTELFGKPFAYLKVIKRFKEYLGDISPEDVLKEGYRSKDDFENIWIDINGSWYDNQIVEVTEFKAFKRRPKD